MKTKCKLCKKVCIGSMYKSNNKIVCRKCAIELTKERKYEC